MSRHDRLVAAVARFALRSAPGGPSRRMPEHFDLLIRGGTLLDGTGAPARRGDVAIGGGRIAALGAVSGTARRVLDAEGAVVAPGVVDRRGTAINVGALVGHTPVRLYVMGEEATEREATADEIAAMRALVADALRAGAVGFATSKAPTHVGWEGRPVPSRVATWEEIETLAGCLADGGNVMQATLGPGLFLDEFAAIQQRTGRPVSWTALLGGMLGPDGHRAVLEQSAAMQARGIREIPRMSCRPLEVTIMLPRHLT